MSRWKSAAILLPPIALFVILQGLALGLRAGEGSAPLVDILQALAAGIGVVAVGIAIWVGVSSRHLAAAALLAEQSSSPVWVGLKFGPTVMALEQLGSSADRLSLVYAIRLSDDSLDVLSLPSQAEIARLRYTDIKGARPDVLLWRTTRNPVLVLDVARESNAVSLPLSLANLRTRGFVAETEDKLRTRARDLMVRVASAS